MGKAAVARCEEEYSNALAHVETQLAHCRASEVMARDAAIRARNAEDRAAALSREEAEKAEICHSTPAKLERLHAHHEELEQRKALLMHDTGQVNLEARQSRRHSQPCKPWQQSTQSFLNSSRHSHLN